MFYKVVVLVVSALSFVGCASVSMESPERAEVAKQFNPPQEGKSGLYIYRSGMLGSALKKDIWVDEECVGESAPDVFFYTEVDCDQEHKISTESEFSPNDIMLKTDCEKHYFVKQYIKLGAFVGGANVEQVSEEKGKSAVRELDMAKVGNCSSTYN